MSDQTERLLTALEESTRVTTEVQGHIKGLAREFVAFRESTEREFVALRETFDRQLGDLEQEMKSTNAHLDNLVREAVVTNDLLREDQKARQVVEERRLEIEDEDRQWRRKMEERRLDRTEEIEDEDREDKRTRLEILRDAGGEAWGVFKHPLGYLITGIVAWVLYTNFAVPPEVPPPPALEPADQASP